MLDLTFWAFNVISSIWFIYYANKMRNIYGEKPKSFPFKWQLVGAFIVFLLGWSSFHLIWWFILGLVIWVGVGKVYYKLSGEEKKSKTEIEEELLILAEGEKNKQEYIAKMKAARTTISCKNCEIFKEEGKHYDMVNNEYMTILQGFCKIKGDFDTKYITNRNKKIINETNDYNKMLADNAADCEYFTEAEEVNI